jgi:hypothetical protein
MPSRTLLPASPTIETDTPIEVIRTGFGTIHAETRIVLLLGAEAVCDDGELHQ